MALLDLLRDPNKDPDADPMAAAGVLPLQGGASLGGLPPLAGGSVLKPLIPGGALPRDNSASANAIAPGLNTPGLGPAPSVSDAISSFPTTLKPLVKQAPTPRQTREDFLESDIFHRENPAKPHGFWQNLRHVAAVAGNVAGGLFAPAAMAMIPGTYINNQLTLNRERGELAGDQAQDQKFTSDQAENAHKTAETRLLNAQAEGLENPAVKPKEEHWAVIPEYAGPNGEPVEVEQNSGAMRIAGQQGSGFKRVPKDQKEATPQSQTYDDLLKSGMTPLQAYEKIREKPAGTTINQGTWALDEDPTTGKPVLFNSKTGETKEAPAGVAKAGTFAAKQKAELPVQQALEYATEYGKRSVHTGAGDEALMEKYFELAKPSTGFRMSQPQIDMLKKAQGWMGSMEAHFRHMTTGTWFSDQQRKEIIDTMNDLGAAKNSGGAGPAGGAAAKPAAVSNPKDPLGVL